MIAQSDWTEDGFVGQRFTTTHFTIFSTLRDKAFERALPAFMETVYERYLVTLPPPAPTTRRLTMFVFGSRGEWQRFAARHYPHRFGAYSRILSGGFTEGATSVLFYRDRAQTLATMAHEGWHQYLSIVFTATVPAWLNEGLACELETVRMDKRTPVFTPRHNTLWINVLRRALQQGKLVPLSTLVDADIGRILEYGSHESVQVYYAQVWALVDFLRFGADGRYARAFERMRGDLTVGRFSSRLSAAALVGDANASLHIGARAIQSYLGCSPADVESDYHKHLITLAAFAPGT